MSAPVATRAALVIGDGATTALRSVVSAAQACTAHGKIDVLLVGRDAYGDSEQAAKWSGVNSVIVGGDDGPVTAEGVTPMIKCEIESEGYGHVLAASTTFGKDVLPRVAGVMGVSTISDVLKVEEGDGDTFVRPIYAGNALATVRSNEKLKMMTIRATAFQPVALQDSGLANVRKIESRAAGVRSRWIGEEKTENSRPDLTSAGVVVSGGRALKSSENFKMLEEIADELGGAVGATRAAVDSGFVSNDMQVGQTGKIVAPELYFAIGLSGAIQHLAGMKDSKTIVAINKDADAPIFQVADYGLVADLFDVLPELCKKIKALPKRE